jgi:hypothetical protein
LDDVSRRELPIFEIRDDERVSPTDIALITTGNKPLEYDTGAINHLDGGLKVANWEKGKGA